jgi:hypothetical protein
VAIAILSYPSTKKRQLRKTTGAIAIREIDSQQSQQLLQQYTSHSHSTDYSKKIKSHIQRKVKPLSWLTT